MRCIKKNTVNIVTRDYSHVDSGDSSVRDICQENALEGENREIFFSCFFFTLVDMQDIFFRSVKMIINIYL